VVDLGLGGARRGWKGRPLTTPSYSVNH